MKKTACPNCGGTIETPYCPQCGQRFGQARLSWSALWEGMMSTLLGEGFDGEKGAAERYGLLGTLWQTVRHPVRTITEFLAGRRRKYFNPITLLLLLSGFCALINSLFGIRYFDFAPVPDGGEQIRLFEYLKAATNYANSHPATYLLLGIPFTSLACKWIFRPRKLRYIEYLYISIFTANLSVIVLFLTSFIPHGLTTVTKSLLDSVPVLCVEIAVYRRIFGRSILRTGGNLLIAYGIGTVVVSLLTAVIMILAAIVYSVAASA